MEAANSPPAVLSTALISALAEGGAIGSTIRQLASRVQRNPDAVRAALESLDREDRVLRMGRGLWVLRDFGDLLQRFDFVEPADYLERFLSENGTAVGSYRGPITSSDNDGRPFHRWWPYVQGYSAEFVRGVLLEGEDRPRVVLDPFCGSGTSLVEARNAGSKAIGVELLPPVALAARVKCDFELNPERLLSSADRLVRRARTRSPGKLPFLRETQRQFSPKALAALTRLRDSLPTPGTSFANALRVAFGSVLIPVSRLRRSPCLGYRPESAQMELDPFAEFHNSVGRMAEDLRQHRATRASWGPLADVRSGDSRALDLPDESIDLAVTSPPYVNGMDYVMNYKLDLAWLGYARGYTDLRRLRSAMVSCDNLPRAEAAPFTQTDHTPDPWLPAILADIRSNLQRKGSYRRQDVHGIVHRYFRDLDTVLRQVYRVLAANGRFVLVIGDSLLAGTYVPGDLIIARIGKSVGFSIDSVEVARARRSGQRRDFRLRESVVTLRKPRSRRAPPGR